MEENKERSKKSSLSLGQSAYLDFLSSLKDKGWHFFNTYLIVQMITRLFKFLPFDQFFTLFLDKPLLNPLRHPGGDSTKSPLTLVR